MKITRKNAIDRQVNLTEANEDIDGFDFNFDDFDKDEPKEDKKDDVPAEVKETAKEVAKEIVNADDLPEVNVKEKSVDDIEAALQKSSFENTTENTVLDTSSAEKVAKEVKDLSTEADVGKVILIPEESVQDTYETVNDVTKTLDLALENSRKNIRRGQSNGSNVAISGLPGSGKTGIISTWAKNRGVNLVEIDAKDKYIDTQINGMPLRDITNTSGNSIARAEEGIIKYLTKPNTVLFLDEFNRQSNTGLRGTLLKLMNEKKLTTLNKDLSKTLLFTIIAINPPNSADPGASKLITAEISRFLYQTSYNSNQNDANAWNEVKTANILKNLGVDYDIPEADFNKLGMQKIKTFEDPTEGMTDEEKKDFYNKQDIVDRVKIYDLSKFLYSGDGARLWQFDTTSNDNEIYTGQYNQLNRRLLDWAIESVDGDPDKLAVWINVSSNLRPDAKRQLLTALSKYKPDYNSIFKKFGLTPSGAKLTGAAAALLDGSRNKEREDDVELENDMKKAIGKVSSNGSSSSPLDSVKDLANGWDFS